MSERDPLLNPRAGDKVTNIDGVVRTIVYRTAYGKVVYTNISGVRKVMDLNGYRKWATEGTAETGAHPGWQTLNTKCRKQVFAEAQKICDHYAANAEHPTIDLVIETLLEFGVAIATSNAHGREKVYAVIRKKIKGDL